MTINTKYGPVAVSSKTAKEFEALAHVPIARVYVEEAMERLSDQERESRQRIEEEILIQGEKEQEYVKEVEEANNSGAITVDLKPSGKTLDIDENGNFYDY